jgi:hypothetical protein
MLRVEQHTFSKLAWCREQSGCGGLLVDYLTALKSARVNFASRPRHLSNSDRPVTPVIVDGIPAVWVLVLTTQNPDHGGLLRAWRRKCLVALCGARSSCQDLWKLFQAVRM